MDRVFGWPPTWASLLMVPALLIGFTVHELAHSVVAFLLGDTSQVERNRLSFNPLRHISWFGVVAFMLVGFGWAKPVWVDYEQLRIKNRPFGMFLVSIAGAAANLVVGILAFLGISVAVGIVSSWTAVPPWELLRILLNPKPGLDAQGLVVALSTYVMSVNLVLAIFNMLPLPMMDGFHAVTSLYTLVRNAMKGSRYDVPLLGGSEPPAAAPEEGPTLTPAEIHFQIGLDYHKAGQWDEAIARYRQAIAHDDQHAQAYYNQGLAYWAKERPELAANAFRGAMQATADPILRTQASLRLREVARARQNPDLSLGPVPPPAEPGSEPAEAVLAPPALAPEVERRIWLHLGIGGAAMVLLAVGIWIYVTIMLASFAGMSF